MDNNSRKTSFVFYDSFFETLRTLDEEDPASANALYRAIALYGLYRVEPEGLTTIQKAIFAGMRAQLEANWIKYENGRKGAGFGKLGGRPAMTDKAPAETPEKPQQPPRETPNVNENVNENVNVNEKEKGDGKAQPAIGKQPPGSSKPAPAAPLPVGSKRQAFDPPPLEAVKGYFSTIGGSEADAESFHDHFTSNGWRVGGRTPMKDFRAAARQWMRRNPGFSNVKNTTSYAENTIQLG